MAKIKMNFGANKLLLISIITVKLVLVCFSLPVSQQEYKIEAFLKDGNPHTLVLRIQDKNKTESSPQTQGRQEEEEAESNLPTSNAFIPPVIPALTKIFQGIITGNLNDIFHGSTSFAPQNVSFAIDTVWNQVVGLPPPTTPSPASSRPQFQPLSSTPPSRLRLTSSTRLPAPSPQAQVTSRSSSASVYPPTSSYAILAGQPLQGQSIIIATKSTPAPATPAKINEEDEDVTEAEGRGV